jgi:GNAT superfamily N-acetyltransferase
MHIRSFIERDFDRVLALTIATFGPFYENHFRPVVGDTVFTHQHGSWRDDYRAQVAGLHDPEHHRFVEIAEDDDHRIVGYAGWNADVDRHHGVIDILAVDTAVRGRGIGTALCERALSGMRDLVVEVVEVGTGGDEFHAPARLLYESLGFTAYPVVAYLREL